ncbi:MAG: hypothetical protein Q8P20_01020 [bacterium]|nr:hypothetical protein [bacterium]MDZ4228050.1 hypothetical protein [Candidatus Levybacteria bacterium]
MIYVYTNATCPKCDVLKIQLKERGDAYIERSADRLKNPQDEIDREALIEASMQNMTLPVMIEWSDTLICNHIWFDNSLDRTCKCSICGIDYDNNIHGCLKQ